MALTGMANKAEDRTEATYRAVTAHWRIANRLDLMGAAYTVDAACASSLVAVQHAVRDLLAEAIAAI